MLCLLLVVLMIVIFSVSSLFSNVKQNKETNRRFIISHVAGQCNVQTERTVLKNHTVNTTTSFAIVSFTTFVTVTTFPTVITVTIVTIVPNALDITYVILSLSLALLSQSCYI